MKAKDLIKGLQALNPEADVEYVWQTEVFPIHKIMPCKNDDKYIFLASKRERGCAVG